MKRARGQETENTRVSTFLSALILAAAAAAAAVAACNTYTNPNVAMLLKKLIFLTS